MLPSGIDEGAYIGKNVVLGGDVTVLAGSAIYDNVTLGDGCFVGRNVVLGEPTRDFYDDPASYENAPLEIGPGAIIRTGTVISCGSRIGAGLETGPHVTVREKCRIGSHFRVGNYSDIQGHLVIGDHCSFHSNVHVGRSTTIGNYVWLMPYVLVTNDRYPPCSFHIVGATIGDYAVIAVRAILLPEVHVGEHALIAAGALVTRDVAARSIVRGVPAQAVGSIEDIRDPETGRHPYPWPVHVRRDYPWAREGWHEDWEAGPPGSG
jgi:acetyltransferase-like isoleucine patch superfamily enzyme